MLCDFSVKISTAFCASFNNSGACSPSILPFKYICISSSVQTSRLRIIRAITWSIPYFCSIALKSAFWHIPATYFSFALHSKKQGTLYLESPVRFLKFTFIAQCVLNLRAVFVSLCFYRLFIHNTALLSAHDIPQCTCDTD